MSLQLYFFINCACVGSGDGAKGVNVTAHVAVKGQPVGVVSLL